MVSFVTILWLHWELSEAKECALYTRTTAHNPAGSALHMSTMSKEMFLSSWIVSDWYIYDINILVYDSKISYGQIIFYLLTFKSS